MSEAPPDQKPAAGELALQLTAPEVALLLRACQRYRITIPAYLARSQEELACLNEVVKKLSSLK